MIDISNFQPHKVPRELLGKGQQEVWKTTAASTPHCRHLCTSLLFFIIYHVGSHTAARCCSHNTMCLRMFCVCVGSDSSCSTLQCISQYTHACCLLCWRSQQLLIAAARPTRHLCLWCSSRQSGEGNPSRLLQQNVGYMGTSAAACHV